MNQISRYITRYNDVDQHFNDVFSTIVITIQKRYKLRSTPYRSSCFINSYMGTY